MLRQLSLAALALFSSQAFALSPLMKDSLNQVAKKFAQQQQQSKRMNLSACADLSGSWAGNCIGTVNNNTVEFPISHNIKQSGCESLKIDNRDIDVGQSETSTTTFVNQPEFISGTTIELTSWKSNGQILFSDMSAALVPANTKNSDQGLITLTGRDSWELKNSNLIHSTVIKGFGSIECNLTK